MNKIEVALLALALIAIVISSSALMLVTRIDLGPIESNLSSLNSRVGTLEGNLSRQSAAQLEHQKLVEGAEKEGSFMLYSSLVEPQIGSLAAAFNRVYPFLKVTYFQGGSAALVTRLEAEESAKKVLVDVFEISDPSYVVTAEQKGFVLSYNSSEYLAYPPAYADPHGYWFAGRIDANVLIYNKKMVSAQDLVALKASWKAMTDPKWNHLIATLDPRGGGGGLYWYYALKQLYGNSSSYDFFRGLAANHPTLYSTNDIPVAKVESGEAALGVSLDYMAYDAIATNPNIGYVYPADGVPVRGNPAYIIAQGPHPNAAKLFLDWWASAVGQEAFLEIYHGYSARSDVPPLPGNPDLTSFKNVVADWNKMAIDSPKFIKDLAQIFGIPV